MTYLDKSQDALEAARRVANEMEPGEGKINALATVANGYRMLWESQTSRTSRENRPRCPFCRKPSPTPFPFPSGACEECLEDLGTGNDIPFPTSPVLTEGARRIAAERERQFTVKDYTAEHDAEHEGELTIAAMAYIAAADLDITSVRDLEGAGYDWPWEEASFKPSSNPVRNLEKAGALVAAEIDRIINSGR